MKRIEFKKIEQPALLQVRSNREQLIADIVAATSDKDKKKLAALIAIKANQMQWTEQDLHALLKKRADPTIRNYTAFVRFSIKTYDQRKHTAF